MGLGRFAERFRQGTGISKDMGSFKGTDNTRIESMLKESDDFEKRLKKFRKSLKEQNVATKDLLDSTQKTLTGELPSIYERDPEGKAIAAPVANNAAGSVNIHNLSDLAARHEAEMKAQVFAPIDQWLELHKEFSHKLSKLNNFRLDLDTARRLHNRSDLQRVRQQQKKDAVEPALMAKLQEQDTELQGKRDAWTQYEAEVHAELSNLIAAAADMHVHLAKAFSISASIYSSVAGSGASLSHPGGGSGGYGGGPVQGGYPSGAGAGAQNLSNPQYVQMST